MLRPTALPLASVLVLVSGTGCTAKQTERLTPDDARAIAEEAYIFAFPMLENYKTMYVQAVDRDGPEFRAPFNRFAHRCQLLGADYTTITSPNNDTLYSASWLDLRREPIVLGVPRVPKDRYYSFQMVDMYTHNFAYIGSRTTGQGPGNYVIAGPNWSGPRPEGITAVFQSEGRFVFNLGRTQVNGEEDIPNVIALQDQYKLMPLSEFLGDSAPEAPPALDLPAYDRKHASSAGFIKYMNFLLDQLEAHPSEEALLAKFAGIGIGPGRLFEPEKLDPDIREAIDQGVAAALEKIETHIKKLGKTVNGWILVYEGFGSRERMQGKYLVRASTAMLGLYGNTLEEALYALTFTDGDGETLDGAKHDYVLRFEKRQLPPVKGFWSITMYRLPERLFVANPIDRYSMGDRTPGLKYGDDGSLTVYIQHESPGRAKESNWLPDPRGPFYLVNRLYWPKPEAIDGTFAPPPVERTDR